nr:biotin/lipoyl-binding protein [Sutterella wadsworthensis]
MDATTVSVAAKVPGRLAAVTVKEGDQVAAGDAVARLTLPEIEAKVAQAKALHEAAAAKADMAQEGARTEELDAARANILPASPTPALPRFLRMVS